MSDDEDELPARRWTRPLMLVIPIALAGAAAWFLYMQHSARERLEVARGHADGAVVVRGDGGAMLVVIDRVTKSGAHRLTALDVKTGRALGTRIVDEAAKCWPASVGKMWCGDAEGHVHLVAVPSFDGATGSDGDQASRTWLGDAQAGCTFVDAVDVGDAHLTFGDGTPRPLVLHLAHDEGQEPEVSSLPGTASFYSPAFVRTADPALLLVQHDAALDRPGAVQLSRVGADRKLAWTVDLGGRCETAAASDGVVLVTTRDPAHRAIAIDAESGKVSWRFAFPRD